MWSSSRAFQSKTTVQLRFLVLSSKSNLVCLRQRQTTLMVHLSQGTGYIPLGCNVYADKDDIDGMVLNVVMIYIYIYIYICMRTSTCQTLRFSTLTPHTLQTSTSKSKLKKLIKLPRRCWESKQPLCHFDYRSQWMALEAAAGQALMLGRTNTGQNARCELAIEVARPYSFGYGLGRWEGTWCDKWAFQILPCTHVGACQTCWVFS